MGAATSRKKTFSPSSPSLSKFQKEMAKYVERLCSPDIPFSIGRSEKNHLRIQIDGCDIISTSCTPSDRRTQVITEGKITKAVRERRERILAAVAEYTEETSEVEISAEQADENAAGEQPEITDKYPLNGKYRLHCKNNQKLMHLRLAQEKCLTSIAAYIRNNAEKFRANESAKVANPDDIDLLAASREALAKEILEHNLQTAKLTALSIKQRRGMLSVVKEHLNFHLPAKAEYLEKMKKKKPKLETKIQELPQAANNEIATSIIVTPALVAANNDTEITAEQMVASIAAIKKRERVQLFRALSESDAKSIVADIQNAAELNRKDNIESITRLMREKNISLDEITAALANGQKK